MIPIQRAFQPFGTADAQQTSLLNVKNSMKLSFFHSLALAGLLGCCSGSADSKATVIRSAFLPVRSAILVKEVNGAVQYSYDGTGWQKLQPGKMLLPGATVRASSASTAILRIAGSSALFRISPATVLHLTAEMPGTELSPSILAVKSSAQ